MTILRVGLLGLTGLLMHPSVTVAKELSAEQMSVMRHYLSETGNQRSIPKEFVQTQAPDKDLEKIGFVVLFTIEDPDNSGRNNYEQWLSVFGTKESGYGLIDSRKVGGKLYRDAKLDGVSDGEIYLKMMFYNAEDPACCPSIEGRTAYYISRSNQLEETATRILSIR